MHIERRRDSLSRPNQLRYRGGSLLRGQYNLLARGWPPPPRGHSSTRGERSGLGSRTVIPDRKTADQPNDWTKCLLGPRRPQGLDRRPLDALGDRGSPSRVCGLRFGAWCAGRAPPKGSAADHASIGEEAQTSSQVVFRSFVSRGASLVEEPTAALSLCRLRSAAIENVCDPSFRKQRLQSRLRRS
jgi:hypothetical protein